MRKPAVINTLFYLAFSFQVAATGSGSVKEAASSNVVEVKADDLIRTADSIASQYHEFGWFSGSVLVSKDNKTLFSKAYGFQDLERKIANTESTKYNLGSIMKHFTKVLVHQHLASGKLRLDDTLAKFELGFKPTIASKITVEHLLNHQSGFQDIFNAEYRADQLSFDTIDKKLALLRDEPLLFEPGTDRKYSNYGYIVLGAIMEKVSQASFESLLQTNIFHRSGMSNVSLHPNFSDKNQSIRYSYLYNGKIKKVGVTEHASPDGGSEASTKEIQKFYRTLFYSDKLLDPKSPIIRQAFNMDGKHWGAYGGGTGVSSAVEVDLVNGYEIVVLANTDSLVAETISGRIYQFITTGSYNKILPRPENFAYDYFVKKGYSSLVKHFKQEYKDRGYKQFIGRTINTLGIELLDAQNSKHAFDIFNYLVSLFPTSHQAYDSLAYYHLRTGNTDEAKKAFIEARKRKADYQSSYDVNNYGIKPSL